jgi:hypothetical protein
MFCKKRCFSKYKIWCFLKYKIWCFLWDLVHGKSSRKINKYGNMVFDYHNNLDFLDRPKGSIGSILGG